MSALKKKWNLLLKLCKHQNHSNNTNKTTLQDELNFDSDDEDYLPINMPGGSQESLVPEMAMYMIHEFTKAQLKVYHANPMKFWSDNKQRYPAIYAVARNIFVSMTSSAASESLFSIAGKYYTNQRMRLAVCDKLLFVKSILDSQISLVDW